MMAPFSKSTWSMNGMVSTNIPEMITPEMRPKVRTTRFMVGWRVGGLVGWCFAPRLFDLRPPAHSPERMILRKTQQITPSGDNASLFRELHGLSSASGAELREQIG